MKVSLEPATFLRLKAAPPDLLASKVMALHLGSFAQAASAAASVYIPLTEYAPTAALIWPCLCTKVAGAARAGCCWLLAGSRKSTEMLVLE